MVTANRLAWPKLLLLALLGALMPLAFAPFSYAWLQPLLLAVLLWFQYGQSPRIALKLGLVFAAPGFAAGLYWIYISTHVYTGAPAALSVFLIALLALYLALYGAAAAALAAWLGGANNGRPQFGRWLLAYVVAWLLLELARNYVMTGFPWFALGYAQVDSLYSGLAPLLGVFSIAVPVLLLAALPLAYREQHLPSVLIPLLVVTAIAYWGGHKSWTVPSGEPMRVAIVQGNIEQDKKWLEESRWPTVQLYRQLTERLIPEADLIVWPEVAIPGAYREFLLSLFRPLAVELHATDTHLLAGIMRWDDEARQFANSVAQVQLPQVMFYDKQHLVPFAEYFPVPSFVRAWLRSLELPFTDLYTGDKYRSPFVVGEQSVAMSICFEDVFAEEVALLARNASLLANVSNDAWFGGSIAAAQHEQIARMRSIENQRWMVRATPTGYSAFIDPKGKIVQQLPRGQVATAVAQLQPREGLTPYMQIRNHWMLLPLLVLLLLIGQRGWQRWCASD